MSLSTRMRWPCRRVGVAAIVLDDTKRVLLVRHSYGRLNWELPGGASEPGETFEETALRELREETGLDGRVERLQGVYYKQDEDSHHLVFRCEVDYDVEPTPNSDEISACAYWSADELPRPVSSFTVRRVMDGLAGNGPHRLVDIPQLTWLE
jgi:8-oxo-dGTP diphosphatase